MPMLARPPSPRRAVTYLRAIAYDILPQLPELLVWLSFFGSIDAEVVVGDDV